MLDLLMDLLSCPFELLQSRLQFGGRRQGG
jgi:hypothetical protein